MTLIIQYLLGVVSVYLLALKSRYMHLRMLHGVVAVPFNLEILCYCSAF